MKPYLIGKIDQSKYTVVRLEEPVGGSRPRIILQNKTTKRKFFLKTYSHNSREIVSELMASKLGELINVNIQTVSLKEIGGNLSNLEDFEKHYILGKKYTFFLDSNGNEENIFKLIESYMQSDANWKKRFKKAIRNLFQNIAKLDIAVVLLKMPVHTFIDFSQNRKKLLFESLLRRKVILKSLL